MVSNADRTNLNIILLNKKAQHAVLTIKIGQLSDFNNICEG